MSELQKPQCPECTGEFSPDVEVDRRAFLTVVGGTAAALTLGGTGAVVQGAVAPRKPKPAEDLVRELFTTLTDSQKKRVLREFNHGARGGRGRPVRMGMYNAAIEGVTIGPVYTKPQQELIQRILRSMASGPDGYRQISRNGTWDNSRSFTSCGAMFFGQPTGTDPYAFVFSGHHLTIRCDGNSEPNAAFGGPIYYGHSPHGYNRSNIFYYQTQQVLNVYDALTGAQRTKALIKRNPGEQAASVQFKARAEDRPGIATGDLTADQRRLVEQVMRTVLSPYRKEDVDEVMEIVQANGGLNPIKLGFYSENSEAPWDFWRLEGPGFVWNYRVLPHVHCFVNIKKLT